MEDSANTGPRRLDTESAIDLLTGDSPATPPDEATGEAAPEEASASESAVTESQANAEGAVEQSETETASEAEETEEESEEVKAEESETESEDEEASEDSEETEAETPVLYTSEDGEEFTLDELIRGNLRQSDYTKKTQTLAEERKAFEEQVEANQQYQQTLSENLQLALSVVDPVLAEGLQTDWESLASEDPYEYTEKKAKFEQAQARYNQIQAANQQLQMQQQEQFQQMLQAKLTEERARLIEAIPELSDAKKGPALQSKIAEYAMNDLGFSQEEMAQIGDHRLFVLLDKARQFDALRSAELKVAKKKVASTPKKTVQPGKPATQAEKTAAAQNTKRQRLKQTGSIDDAVAALLG